MKTVNDIILAIENQSFSKLELVTILELTVSKLNINSLSGMARSENKSRNGIKHSKCYRKIKVGDVLLCVGGVRETDFPF